jgi:hypothetical protein
MDMPSNKTDSIFTRDTVINNIPQERDTVEYTNENINQIEKDFNRNGLGPPSPTMEFIFEQKEKIKQIKLNKQKRNRQKSFLFIIIGFISITIFVNVIMYIIE